MTLRRPLAFAAVFLAAVSIIVDASPVEACSTIGSKPLDERYQLLRVQDGGDITFKGYKDGRVFLHMKGACAGCPSSTATLKHGIQNLLRHFIPEVQEVEAV